MNGDKFGAGPDDACSGESCFETLQPRCAPPGELAPETDFRHGDERDDERPAFQQRPVACRERYPTSEKFGCEHAGVDDDRPSTARLWVTRSPAMAARKRASSSSVRPSITMSSQGGNSDTLARMRSRLSSSVSPSRTGRCSRCIDMTGRASLDHRRNEEIRVEDSSHWRRSV